MGVVIDGGAITVSVKPFLTKAPTESVTVTDGVNGPATVGVPEITPVDGAMDRPEGRPVAENARLPVPGVAAIVWEYGEPSVPLGRAAGVVMVGAGFIVIESG